MKIKNLLSNLAIIICFGVITYSAVEIFKVQIEIRQISAEDNDIKQIAIDKTRTDEELFFTTDSFRNLKSTNNDFQFYLHFHNNLITTPVVKTNDNDYYLTRSFKKTYSKLGTAFMDFNSNFTDTNVVIYGHYYYTDSTRMFGPLHRLKKQSEFEKNKMFDVYFESNYYTYEVLYVYEFSLSEFAVYDFTTRNFANETAFDAFIDYSRSKSYVSTSTPASYGDQLMTMQTCVQQQPDKRLIVVAKLVEQGLLTDKEKR